MVLCVRMVCNCRRLIAERKVWRGYARTEPHGTRLRLPEDSKPYPLRLKKCQASHARHNERMLIMRRRRQSRATAARVASLSKGGRCRGVGWGPKKVTIYVILRERVERDIRFVLLDSTATQIPRAVSSSLHLRLYVQIYLLHLSLCAHLKEQALISSIGALRGLHL